LFKTVVKTAFNQRRKTMRNSLKSLLGKGNELFTHPIFDKRPEQLSVEEFIDLVKQIGLFGHSPFLQKNEDGISSPSLETSISHQDLSD
jgi:16S rRNA (adenine1518-N6/adenine1519-N6)-dimethyltransferase